MIKVYIGKLISGYSHHPLLYKNLGRPDKKTRLFLNTAFDVIKEPLVGIVDSPQESDFFMLPYEYFVIEKEKEYLYQFISLASEYKKKILIFDWSDYDKKIDIPTAIIFRVSQYKKDKLDNVIVILLRTLEHCHTSLKVICQQLDLLVMLVTVRYTILLRVDLGIYSTGDLARMVCTGDARL
jgi:hypothetical protein